MSEDVFGARNILKTPHGEYMIYSIDSLERQTRVRMTALPFVIRTLLASQLMLYSQGVVTSRDVINLAGWKPYAAKRGFLPFRPARVLMQDYSGVSSLIDLAALRATLAKEGGDPSKINPLVPVDLVVDHSVQVDFFADRDAVSRNSDLEFQRNRERYEFIKWGQNAFSNLRVIPPGSGILHQINLEYFSPVVMAGEEKGVRLAYPDSIVGADSHTTTINALGVIGWGVGGIEAEAIMLGQPYGITTPDVIGVRLEGNLKDGATATDLALTINQLLHRKGFVDKFIEFFGAGLDTLSLPDRATIANMASECSATMFFFPVDDETLHYLRDTGRSNEVIERVEWYTKAQGLFRTSQIPVPQFTDTITLNLEDVEACLAGPKRPQDRLLLGELKKDFNEKLITPFSSCGYGLNDSDLMQKGVIGTNGGSVEIGHGAVVIAAITSCTNTSNPSLMLAAGLVARNALERGLKVKAYVKTSLAPGSRVTTEYLQKAELLEPLSHLGFNVVGYGCTTCIGNSGALPGEVVKAITGANLVTAAVLSGSRNFEGRIHPLVRANFLASPPLVVAYALAGTVDINLNDEPLGLDSLGIPVFLKDIWPSNQEILELVLKTFTPETFIEKYDRIFDENKAWNNLLAIDDVLYPWKSNSTYIREPILFQKSNDLQLPISDILGARALGILGDFISTDHISPAGAIPIESPAGKYLLEHGVAVRDFNTYGARRGNDQVMIRGAFSNLRLKNRMLSGTEGGFTIHQPEGEKMTFYDAAMRYEEEGVPLLLIAGKEYGGGSCRDWAAKGTRLLGVRAVIAESFERVHRSNLIAMGVLPLQFLTGEDVTSLALTGNEVYDIENLADHIAPDSSLTVRVSRPDGSMIFFKVQVQIRTPLEANFYKTGGIFPTLVRNML
ncbi:MAG: aconitate hydratase AcnA [Anaerolineales bacterium]|nr:aconitate hydratase AcnA [Anaerolineales bacterium]